MRCYSGHENQRVERYEEFGEDLLAKFAKISPALEKRRVDWGSDEDEDEDGVSAKKGLPEKKKKRLLDPKTWERAGRLVEVATTLRKALGEAFSEDHNLFRDRVDVALKKTSMNLPEAGLQQIMK